MEKFFNDLGNWFVNNWKNILIVVAYIVVGIVIIKLIIAFVKRRFAKSKMEKTVQTFVLSITKFILYLILIICIASRLGISITGVTIVISAISLAVTLSLQDSLKNLVNGFVIVSTKLVKEGDWIKVDDFEGAVRDVRMLYTVLQTADNKRITIPNTSIISSSIVNYNFYQMRRIDQPFDIAYDSDVDLAKKVIMEVIESASGIFENPKPRVILSSLNGSSITLTARFWCSSSDYWETKWYIIDNVFNELKRNNITIPFNQIEVGMVDPNKQMYVREQTLQKVIEHKSAPEEEKDFIDMINKSLRDSRQKQLERYRKYKINQAEKKKKNLEKKEIKKQDLREKKANIKARKAELILKKKNIKVKELQEKEGFKEDNKNN